jgi:hypothetical protein
MNQLSMAKICALGTTSLRFRLMSCLFKPKRRKGIAQPKFWNPNETVTAEQWLKRGDHPRVKPLQPLVKYRCDKCGVYAHKHGWIVTSTGVRIVCPGDWVLTRTKNDTVFSVKPGLFSEIYELVENV